MKSEAEILRFKDYMLYKASISISRAGGEVSIEHFPEALIGKLELQEEEHRRGEHIYRLAVSDGLDNTYAVELCSHARFPRRDAESISQCLVFVGWDVAK